MSRRISYGWLLRYWGKHRDFSSHRHKKCVISGVMGSAQGEFSGAKQQYQWIDWHLVSLFTWVEKIPTVGCWDIKGNIGFPVLGMEICIIAGWLILHYGQFLKAKKKGQWIDWHLVRLFVQVERIPTVGCWDIWENIGSPLWIGGGKKCVISRNSTFCAQTRDGSLKYFTLKFTATNREWCGHKPQ